MTTAKIRELGKFGIIADAESYDTPLNTFDVGVNVRFVNGAIERGPVFRKSGDLAQNPRHVLNYEDANGTSHLIYVDTSGRVYDWNGSSGTDKSPASGWTSSVTDASVTVCRLNGVIYVNRTDQEPKYRSVNSTGNFALLSTYNSGNGRTQFGNTTRFATLRSIAGVLVGGNVTVGAITYPTRVQWSNIANNSMNPPPDWDVANASSSAGQNDIHNMEHPIVDIVPLGSRAIIYCTHETFMMTPTGDFNMFRFDRMFGSGVISQNCVVEAENMHFVFGDADIYVTDGNDAKSISNERVREQVYGSLQKGYTKFFFAFHNPNLNEIVFCYRSADPYCKFSVNNSAVGCNRAAVYSLASKNWSFYDLPFVTSATMATVNTVNSSWNSSSGTSWDIEGGSWAQLGDSAKYIAVYSGVAFTPEGGSAQSAQLRSLEAFSFGANVGPVDTVATGPVTLIKSKICLDELGQYLTGYNYVSHIWPKASLTPGAMPMVFTIGSTDHPTQTVVWTETQTFDEANSRLDFDTMGRFLGLKITVDDYRHFKLSGFDIEIAALGQ